MFHCLYACFVNAGSRRLKKAIDPFPITVRALYLHTLFKATVALSASRWRYGTWWAEVRCGFKAERSNICKQ